MPLTPLRLLLAGTIVTATATAYALREFSLSNLQEQNAMRLETETLYILDLIGTDATVSREAALAIQNEIVKGNVSVNANANVSVGGVWESVPLQSSVVVPV